MTTYVLAFYRAQGTHWDALVRTLTRSSYSHVEMGALREGRPPLWLSSSPRDGGVRLATFPVKPTHWDFIVIDHSSKTQAIAARWKKAEATLLGSPYDWGGAFGAWAKPLSKFVSAKRRWFCSELIAWLLEWPDPERYTPQDVYDMALGHRLGHVATPEIHGMSWRMD